MWDNSPVAMGSGETQAAADAIELARMETVVKLLQTGLRLLIAVALGILTLGLSVGDDDAVIAAAGIVVTTPLLLLALRRGHAAVGMIGSVLLLIGMGSYVLISGGGIHDVGVSIFAAALVLSALLLERRSSIVCSALALLALGGIGVAELTGALQTRYSDTVSGSDLTILLVVLTAMAVLMQILSRGLYRGLLDAYTSEQKYAEIFNATTEVLVLLDDDGLIVDANDRATALSGFTRDELIGAPARQFLVGEGRADDDSDAAARLNTAIADGPIVFEQEARNKNGPPRLLEVSLRAATIGGEARIVGAARDVTDQRAMAEQIRASERLGALGELAGGVAHDFNNQLTVILAHANLLEMQLSDDPRAREALDAIIQSSSRSADLTRQLLAFARKGKTMHKPVDVAALVREVVSLLGRSIDKRIDLSIEPPDAGVAHVLGDPSPLQNALLNLGLNARDAMPDGGELRFVLSRIDRSQLSKRANDEVDADAERFVQLHVIDSGSGMAPEVAARVFEPFYTTKSDGNGMGLAATYGTVRSHGGSIGVESRPGEGSTFEVVLPLIEQAAAEVAADPVDDAPLRLRVLFAEDDPHVASVTVTCLDSLGCTVTHCEDGRSALDVFEAEPGAFDVVMIDHGMPRMTGGELAVHIAAAQPRLPIIATSGFGDEWKGPADVKPSIVLPKPYSVAQLRAALLAATS